VIKRLAIIGFLALGTALGSSAASAAPAPAGLAGLSQAKTSGIELVQHRRGHYRHRHFRRGYGTRHYRHRNYRGWHRYSHRPYNWRSRGCVIVGPVWFCP